MSSSIARYLPAVGGRDEPRSRAPENLAAPSLDGRPETPPFTEGICTLELIADEALVALICKGNTEAFAGLFDRYARIVRSVALRILKDPSEADDLLQDIFILIHRLCGTFDSSKGSAKVWILQMACRRAISRRRYLNSRHFYTQVELDEETIQSVGPSSGNSDEPTPQILAELDLQKLLGTLSEDQQKTLRLHFIEGYTCVGHLLFHPQQFINGIYRILPSIFHLDFGYPGVFRSSRAGGALSSGMKIVGRPRCEMPMRQGF
jgi:RNA polymerase sigma-70 factor, ECF subfamily